LGHPGGGRNSEFFPKRETKRKREGSLLHESRQTRSWGEKDRPPKQGKLQRDYPAEKKVGRQRQKQRNGERDSGSQR